MFPHDRKYGNQCWLCSILNVGLAKAKNKNKKAQKKATHDHMSGEARPPKSQVWRNAIIKVTEMTTKQCYWKIKMQSNWCVHFVLKGGGGGGGGLFFLLFFSSQKWYPDLGNTNLPLADNQQIHRISHPCQLGSDQLVSITFVSQDQTAIGKLCTLRGLRARVPLPVTCPAISTCGNISLSASLDTSGTFSKRSFLWQLVFTVSRPMASVGAKWLSRWRGRV